MNHVRFISSNHAVCDKPRMLGLDTVVVDYSDEICKTCMSLIMAYNERIDNYDLALSIPKPGMFQPEDTRVSRQFLAGALAGCLYMFIMALAFFMMFGR